MKKLMILAVIVSLGFGASSCKKEGTCQCTTNGVTVDIPGTTSKSDCEKLSVNGVSCKLK